MNMRPHTPAPVAPSLKLSSVAAWRDLTATLLLSILPVLPVLPALAGPSPQLPGPTPPKADSGSARKASTKRNVTTKAAATIKKEKEEKDKGSTVKHAPAAEEPKPFGQNFPINLEWRQRLRMLAKQVDEIAREHEEWGSVSMSAPIIVKPDTTNFSAELNYPGTDFFTNAKADVEGSAAARNATRTITSTGLSVAVDPTRLEAGLTALRNARTEQALFEAESARKAQARQLKDSAASLDYTTKLKTASMLPTEAERNAAIAAADRSYADALLANGTTVTAPTIPVAATDATNSPAVPGKGTLAAPPSELSAALGTLGTGLPTFGYSSSTLTRSDRSALIEAAGNRAVQGLFNALGKPAEASKFEGKRIVMAIATVAVNPGWRTQRDFSGQLNARIGFTWRIARPEIQAIYAPPAPPTAAASEGKEPSYKDGAALNSTSVDLTLGLPVLAAPEFETEITAGQAKSGSQGGGGPPGSSPSAPGGLATGGKTPTVRGNRCDTNPWGPGDRLEESPIVAAVSPLMETQALDLEDQYQKQNATAFYLAAALRYYGADAKGEVFRQFLRERDKVAKTRSANAVANSFSASGGVFGFQVGPRLKALADAASRIGGSANVLERQSFPVLIIIGIDENDLAPAWGRLNGDKCKPVLMEPVLTIHQSPQWLPIKRKLISFRDLLHLDFSNVHQPRMDELKRLKHELAVADRSNHFDQPNSKAPAQYADLTRRIRTRLESMSSLVNGSSGWQYLPTEFLFSKKAPAPPAPAAITHINPGAIKLTSTGYDGIVVIRGEGISKLQPADISAASGGVPFTIPEAMELEGQGLMVHIHIDATVPTPNFLVAKLTGPNGSFTLFTPPIAVTSDGPPPAPSKLLPILQSTIETTGANPSTKKITINADASVANPVLGTAKEIIKDEINPGTNLKLEKGKANFKLLPEK